MSARVEPTCRSKAAPPAASGRASGPARYRSCRALTLIEAIALVTIMAVAVPTMMWSMASAHENRTAPLMTSRARFLAAERLEQIIADRFSPRRGYTYIVAGNYPAEAAISGFASFGRSVAITETGPALSGSGTGYKTVTTTITWLTRKGPQTLKLSTVITDF